MDTRARVEKKIAQGEREKKEERLREMALQARTNRAGIRAVGNAFIRTDERGVFSFFSIFQIRPTKKRLSETKFDTNDRKIGNELLLCKRLEARNGTVHYFCAHTFHFFCLILEIVPRNVMSVNKLLWACRLEVMLVFNTINACSICRR